MWGLVRCTVLLLGPLKKHFLLIGYTYASGSSITESTSDKCAELKCSFLWGKMNGNAVPMGRVKVRVCIGGMCCYTALILRCEIFPKGVRSRDGSFRSLLLILLLICERKWVKGVFILNLSFTFCVFFVKLYCGLASVVELMWFLFSLMFLALVGWCIISDCVLRVFVCPLSPDWG